ncbi:MAG: glycosyltransferase family 2 protein [Candidatus Woesearchaeota archaeon]
MKPLVSVLMPNYNSEKYLAEAIESVLSQTFTDFEFIIIDDYSSDKSWDIIQKYAKKDSRIKAYRNEKNLGIVKTRNKLFSLAKGKYFAIFDSDDVCFRERLELQVAFLEKNKDYGLVGGNLIIIDEDSKKIGFRKYEKEVVNALYKSPVAQPSSMIRASVLGVVGVYSSEKGFDRSRDFDLWVRIFDKYKIRNIQKPLIKYRISKTQGKTTHLKETIKSTIQVQRKWIFKKKYFSLKSLSFMLLYYFLLLLPNSLVLWLFKKKEFKK